MRLDELLGEHGARSGARGLGHLDGSKMRWTICLGGDLLGLGLVGEDDAVAQHVEADGLHVLGRDVAAVAQERVRARGQVQRDRWRAGWRRTR